MSDKILEDEDYIAHNGCWITCGTSSIRIYPSPEGIRITVHRLGQEDQGGITEIFTSWSELEEYIS